MPRMPQSFAPIHLRVPAYTLWYKAAVYKRFANGTWQLTAELESEAGCEYPSKERVAISADGRVVVVGEGGSSYDGTAKSGKGHETPHMVS